MVTLGTRKTVLPPLFHVNGDTEQWLARLIVERATPDRMTVPNSGMPEFFNILTRANFTHRLLCKCFGSQSFP